MQLCRIIYYSLSALHVSSDIFAHHQEHLNCITASGITHVCRYRLVSWECWRECWNWLEVTFLTGAQDSHLQRVMIPEAAYIQLRRRPPKD